MQRPPPPKGEAAVAVEALAAVVPVSPAVGGINPLPAGINVIDYRSRRGRRKRPRRFGRGGGRNSHDSRMGFELANTLVERVDSFTKVTNSLGDGVELLVHGPHGAVHVHRLDGGRRGINRFAEFNLIQEVPSGFRHLALLPELAPFREFERGDQRDFELLTGAERRFGDRFFVIDRRAEGHFDVLAGGDDEKGAGRDGDLFRGRERGLELHHTVACCSRRDWRGAALAQGGGVHADQDGQSQQGREAHVNLLSARLAGKKRLCDGCSPSQVSLPRRWGCDGTRQKTIDRFVLHSVPHITCAGLYGGRDAFKDQLHIKS